MEFTTVNMPDVILLIKAAHNGSINAENALYSYHKNTLEKSLSKYTFLHFISDDLTNDIESTYRVAIHKYRIESNVKFISFASWFIKNYLERKCAEIG